MIGRLLRLGLALALLAGLAGPAIADDAPFRIYMITWRGWTDTDQGFKDYFARRHIPVELIHRDVNRDVTRFPSLIDEIAETRPDLVYVWGTSVAQGIIAPAGMSPEEAEGRFVTDIPVVFANVSQPVGSGIVRDLGPSGRNVTGSTYLVPLRVQLQAILSYRPITRLGVVYNAQEDNSVLTVKELRAIAPEFDVALIERPVPVVDGEPDPASVAPLVSEVAEAGAEFLYIPPDSFLSRRRHDLTEAALRVGLPTFAAAEGTLEDSKALMGLISRYYTIGQLAAFQAERILRDGVDPGSMPIEGLRRYSLIVDMAVARALDLYPPMLMLRFAEVRG